MLDGIHTKAGEGSGYLVLKGGSSKVPQKHTEVYWEGPSHGILEVLLSANSSTGTKWLKVGTDGWVEGSHRTWKQGLQLS